MLSVAPSPGVTFRLRHQDDDLLVVEKRSGLVTQPGKGHETDTLLNGLFAAFGPRLQNLGRSRDFGLLHRLDKETSGLLLVALSARAYDALRADFEARRIRKFYWAICAKPPTTDQGVIRLAIAEASPARGGGPKLARIIRGKAALAGARTTTGAAAKAAVTAFRVLAKATGGEACLIEARPLTGRLHQVRVHFEAIGCPILGDEFYASPAVARAAPRLALHAHRLAFKHPITAAPIDTHAPWPRDLRATLRRFGLPRPDLAPGAAEAPAAETDES